MVDTCFKCGAKEEEGELIGSQATVHHEFKQVRWGIYEKARIGAKLAKEARIIAYRCSECGYIELWAPEEG